MNFQARHRHAITTLQAYHDQESSKNHIAAHYSEIFQIWIHINYVAL